MSTDRPDTSEDPRLSCQDCYDIAHDEIDERDACPEHEDTSTYLAIGGVASGEMITLPLDEDTWVTPDTRDERDEPGTCRYVVRPLLVLDAINGIRIVRVLLWDKIPRDEISADMATRMVLEREL